MRFPNTKLSAVAANKDVRYYLNGILLDVERARVVATNGHMVAVLPAEPEDGDVTGIVQTSVVKAASSPANVKLTGGEVCIRANGALTLADGSQYLRDPIFDGATFPDIDRIIPEKTSEPDFAVNADYLKALQDAICTNKTIRGLRFYFQKNADGSIDGNAAIRVESISDDDKGIGVVMPMRA